MPEQLSQPMTVAAIINGCIGGVILLLPVKAIQTGWLLTALTILFTGSVCLFTSWLQLRHSASRRDFDSVILQHFNGAQWVKLVYNISVWSSLFVLSLFYFNFVVIMWQILVPKDLSVPLINAAVVALFTIFLQCRQLGAHTLALGLISIIAYMMFLVWSGVTAPSGQATFPLTGNTIFTSIALFQGGFGIQIFFMPVIKRHPNPHNHLQILVISMIGIFLCYCITSFIGGYGILNRTHSEGHQEITIFSYFEYQISGQLLAGTFLIHFYSALPQYILISKKRMFGALDLPVTQGLGANLLEVVYIIVIVVVCLLSNMAEFKLNDLGSINGAVVGFCFIYLFPIMVEVKCSLHNQEPYQDNALQLTEGQGNEQEIEYQQKCEEGKLGSFSLCHWVIMAVLMLIGFTILIITLVNVFL